MDERKHMVTVNGLPGFLIMVWVVAGSFGGLLYLGHLILDVFGG